MQAPLTSRKSCLFGTSCEQRWWPRHDCSTARLAVSSLARDCRLYVARHAAMFQVVIAVVVELATTRGLRLVQEVQDAQSFLLSCSDPWMKASTRARAFECLLASLSPCFLCPPRAEQDHGSPFEPTTTALSLRRSPLAAPQRSATQHKDPSTQAVDGVSVAIVT
ncbi:hypothetical protein HDV63DRAFT_112808 [Trichoderma sp. SZMC 28014]